MVELSNGSNAIKNSEKNSIRPNFGRQPHGERQDSAIANLGSYEGGAADNNFFGGDANNNGVAENADEQQSNLFSDASDREEQPDDGFTNAVRGRDEKVDGKGEGKVKAFLKKKSAAIIFTLIIGGTGGMMFSFQSMFPVSFLENAREMFDSTLTMFQRRSDVFFKKTVSNDDIQNPILKKTFLGSTKYKASKKQQTKLEGEGLYLEEDFGGTGKTALLFDDGTGSLKIVGANSSDVEAFKKLDLDQVTIKNGSIDTDKFDITLEGIDTFDGKFKSSSDFKNGYIKGSRTWRTSIGAWFDNIAYRFLQSNAITRNMFKDFQERVRSEANGNTRTEAISAMKEKIGDTEVNDGSSRRYVDEDGNVRNIRNVEDFDDNGNIIGTHLVDMDNGGATIDPSELSKLKVEYDGGTTVKTKEEAVGKVKDIATKENNSFSKASGYVGMATNMLCGVFNFLGSVEMIAFAHESIQIIQLVSGYFEAIDKMRAGEGADSPINDLMNALTTPANTTIEVSVDTTSEDITDNDLYQTRTEIAEGKAGTTAAQSSGFASIFSHSMADPSDASVQNFNIGSRFSSLAGKLGASMESFAACAGAKLAASIADLAIEVVETVVTIAACIGSMGIACVAKVFIDAGKEFVGKVGGSVAFSTLLSMGIQMITPLVVKVFTRDLIEDLAGEDLGNALASGANMLQGSGHRAGGGSLADYDSYIAFRAEQEKVIAEEADYQRATRSPFDITSQYTFLGSLVRQLSAFSAMNSAPTNVVTTFGGIVSNSVIALLPSASAIDISSSVMTDEEYTKICPTLASIGATGDAFCNPYIITDTSTLEKDPEEVINDIQDGNLITDASDSNFGKIKKGSNLAKYILYCNERSSSFGVADSNISGSIDKTDVDTGTAFDAPANAAIGSIPVIGNILDVISNSTQLANMGWISGESCVTGNDAGDGFSASISWSEAKDYQRYIEDQRILENTQDDYKSTVAQFLDEYYAENPLDNSYEGILARKSGLTKETVVAVLEQLQYENYLANYNPSDRYSFNNEEPHSEIIMFESAKNSETAILQNDIEYFDNRNRVFAIA